jgi:hypothetical protein
MQTLDFGGSDQLFVHATAIIHGSPGFQDPGLNP